MYRITLPLGKCICLVGLYAIVLSPLYAQKTKTDSTHQLETLIVKGVRVAPITSGVASRVKREQISQNLGRGIASLLESVSGVSSIQTGTTTAKPVIHGMHSNRILIINNGAKQMGQQWGEDHAPELDISGAGRVYVVKGAETVRYGSEAMGGIIIAEQAPLPHQAGFLGGELTTLYATNGQRTSSNLRLEGSIPKLTGFAYRLQGAYTNAGDRSTANYLLNNTGVRSGNLSASLGWRGENWRIEGYWSRYDNKEGILRSAQLGDVQLLRERIAIGRPLEVQPFSRSIAYPYHHVIHDLYTLKAEYNSPLGKWNWRSSYQTDDRREYNLRRGGRSHLPGLSLQMQSLQHQLAWERTYGAWRSEIGGQYSAVDNRNQAGTGITPLIPNYTEYSYGSYAVQRYKRGALTLEGGVRLDLLRRRSAGYDAYGRYYGGKRKYTNLSYSLGGSYEISRGWTISSSFGQAWRAPHVHELYSNGHEHGSATYVIGDENIGSERGYKWITNLHHRTADYSIQLTGYAQWIRGYIYDAPTGEIRSAVSGSYPVFRYRQANAFFRGIDLDVDYRLPLGLSYQLTTSAIWANDSDTKRYLPYIPSWRIAQGLSWIPKVSFLPEAKLSVRHRFVLRQKRFDPATDLIPYAPPSYSLWSIEANTRWHIGGRSYLHLMLTGENIFNKEYKEYTNRTRYYAHDAGQDLRISLSWEF